MAPNRIDSKPRGWITANVGSIEFTTTPISGNSTARLSIQSSWVPLRWKGYMLLTDAAPE